MGTNAGKVLRMTRNRPWIIASTLAVSSLGIVGVARGTTNTALVSSNQVVHACYFKSGALQVRLGKTCPPNSHPITWNLKGTKGSNGARGPVGLAGAKGAQGLTGVAGPTGAKGAQGLTGVAGPTGAKGVQGLTGVAGPTGAKGVQGPAGVAGPTGAPATQCEVTDTTNATTYTDLQTAINGATSGDTLAVTGECVGQFSIGSGALTIMGMPTAALNGARKGTVVTVGASANVTLMNLVITDGVADDGGGIYNYGTLTIDGNSQVDGNSANFYGGGIYNTSSSTLTLNGDSQVDGNSASPTNGGRGGGIFGAGTLTLNDDSQVDGNSAFTGGGIWGTPVVKNNSLVANNSPDNIN